MAINLTVVVGGGDTTAPTINTSFPADNAVDVAVSASPTITFSEPVVFGTGLITLRQNIAGTWSDLETFDVVTEVGAGNGQVSISGAVLTINPTASFAASTEFAIRIAATAIDDLVGNSFAGIANDTTISFTSAPIDLRSSVTQGDTTFTFSKAVQVGQYWNGDWWAVADPTATITSITPVGANVSGRIVHGLMKNPMAGEVVGTNQGFDSSTTLSPTRGPLPYSSGLNLDPTITGSPITLTEGSYVKAESYLTPTGDTRIKTYTVLTVVPSAPAANSFRPGIRASSKALTKTTADINWALRRNISGFTPVADPTSGLDQLKKLQWTWAARQELQRGYWPGTGLNVYGANWGDDLGPKMLAFHGDYTQAQLEEVTHAIVQIGIDLIAAADNGLRWPMEEGHHVYRKFPALMAALLLNDAAWKTTVDWNVNPLAFGNDDDAHYYITQPIIDASPVQSSKTNYPYGFQAEHLGMPEWGSAVQTGSTDGINAPDLRVSYRVLNGLRHIQGVAWVFGTTGAEALCNPAMLDYWDRMAEILSGHYVSSLYSTTIDPPFNGNWNSTPFGPTKTAQYNTLRALSARPVFVNVPEEMPAPALTAVGDGTVTVAANATNPFLAPRNATSAITSYQLRWRPITNLTGTSTPDASVGWTVITGIGSLPYTLTGLPGATQIRAQIRAMNGEGPGIWHDSTFQFIAGATPPTAYTATVTTASVNTSPQNFKAPVAQLAVLGSGQVATCDPGIWGGRPASPTITYQWQRSTDGGATWPTSLGTSQTYTTQAGDVGNRIRCAVTATNATGATTVNTASRTISGSPTTAFTPAMAASLFRPIWYYATKVYEDTGYVYGKAGGATGLYLEDGALRLNEISGANFDNVANVNVRMDYELSSVNSAVAQIILRGGGDNNQQGYILGYQRGSSSGSTILVIDRLDSVVKTRIGTLAIGGAGYPINTRRSLRAEATGTTVRVRTWLTADSEPGTWGLSVTDATYASGFVGTLHPVTTITRIYKFDVTV